MTGAGGGGFATRRLPRATQRIVPWRNGGGSTREIAIEPPDGSVAKGFDWRISIAGVAADGPFSPFPGVDRSLWLLAGAGMEMDVGGRCVRLHRRFQRCDFAGEVPVVARLLGGPTEDLNVMVARDRIAVRAAVHELATAAVVQAVLAPGSHVVCALSGELTVAGERLAVGDALRLDGAGTVEIGAAGPAAWLLADFAAVQR